MTTYSQTRITELLAHPEQFKAWLEEHIDQPVGWTGSAWECPIRNWIEHALAPDIALVGLVVAGKQVTWAGAVGTPIMVVYQPEWGRLFVSEFDDIAAQRRRKEKSLHKDDDEKSEEDDAVECTGAEALAALERVQPLLFLERY